MILMIDNFDSFTYNIAQYLLELDADVKVVQNDIPPQELLALNPSHIVISPGPCTPDKAGSSIPAIKLFAGKIPILGVCLGHQCIAQAFGGTITQSNAIMHGKTSKIYHDGKGVFLGLGNPFTAMRYHSLTLALEDIPDAIEVTAWTQKLDGSRDEVMGIRHKKMTIEGVQFHPESVLSEHGHRLLNNFLKYK